MFKNPAVVVSQLLYFSCSLLWPPQLISEFDLYNKSIRYLYLGDYTHTNVCAGNLLTKYLCNTRGNQSFSSLTLEAIRTKPALKSQIIASTVNGSCDVLLECSGPSDINVSYSWTVGNQTQTHRLPSLQHTIRPEDGAPTFTCTVSNAVSRMSETTRVTCSNQPSDKSTFRKVILEGKMLQFF